MLDWLNFRTKVSYITTTCKSEVQWYQEIWYIGWECVACRNRLMWSGGMLFWTTVHILVSYEWARMVQACKGWF